MIEKHLTLSCYTLEHPFTTNYSHFDEELLDIIDSSNDIYEFKLVEAELYEKINGGGHLKQIKRMGDLSFILYHGGKLIVRRKSEQLYELDDIQQIEMIEASNGILIVLRSNKFYPRQELSFKVGFINRHNQQQQELALLKIQTLLLEQEILGQDHFQKYVSQFGSELCRIQMIMNSYCLVTDNNGEKCVYRLHFEQITKQSKTLKFRKLDFQLNEKYAISGIFKDHLLVYDGKESILIDCQHQRIVLLKDLQAGNSNFDIFIFKNFLIAIVQNTLCIFETIKGNKMAEINIDSMLEEFQEGSSIIKEEINSNDNKQLRYKILYDEVSTKLTHFYLFDKEKLGLFHFNANKLLQRGFIKTIKENLQNLQSDDEKYHQNIMKTLNFRVKKLETLEKYLLEDLKTLNFGNTIRFLINEQTIYVLNDGLSLFYHAIINNISKFITNKQMMIDLERQIVKIGHRLITQSNYENQIANGLHILNNIYTNFRKQEDSEGFQKNKQIYTKLLETNRIIKLLKNEKKKKLFELSYQLALKVKGYKYLEHLDHIKGK